jgi:hypothetical protein
VTLPNILRTASTPLRSRWRLLAAAASIGEASAHIPVTAAHLSEAPYVGVGFVLLTIAGLLLAQLLLVADSALVWVATSGVATLALAGYLLSRTVGLPQIRDDIGNWTEPLGLVAIVTEAIMLLAATAELAAGHGARMGRFRPLALLPATALLLTGCAAALATGPSAPALPTSRAAMTPGMVMPDGSTMGAAAAPAASPVADGQPSAAAAMICTAKTRQGIGTALGLAGPATATATWHDHVYTCDYRLPYGRLVLSVTEAADANAAGRQLATLRRLLGSPELLPGLTTGAFGTAGGIVALSKDNDVLEVDASRLPAVFGSQQEQRAAFAYEVASDVLGCWTGD